MATYKDEYLENVILNPAKKYDIDKGIPYISLRGKDSYFSVGFRYVRITYNKYQMRFYFNPEDKKLYPSCDVRPVGDTTHTVIHFDKDAKTFGERVQKMWNSVPQEIQDRALKHANFLYNHFTYEYTREIKKRQEKLPHIVDKRTGKPFPKELLPW